MSENNIINSKFKSKKHIRGRSSFGVALINLGSHSIDIGIAIEDNHELRVVGNLTVSSYGFKSGLISHPQKVADILIGVIEDCEIQSGVKSIEAHIAFSSSSFQLKNQQNSVFLGGVIREGDIQKLIRESRVEHRQKERRNISDEVVDFAIDGRWGAQHPHGLFAHSLAVQMVSQSLDESIVINLSQLFSDINLRLASITSSGEASGEVLLSDEERELGSIIIDIGAESSGVIVFSRGVVVAVEYFPIGSKHITMDISRGLSLGIEQAERLKHTHGNVGIIKNNRFEDITLTRWGGDMQEHDSITSEVLNNIIEARCHEIINKINHILTKDKELRHCSMVCHITGHTAGLLGIDKLTEDLLQIPSRRGYEVRVEGRRVPSVIWGLAASAQRRMSEPNTGFMVLKESWLKRIRHWIRFQD